MKILGIVLARGGSKRIPRKNVRLLGARPLIAWSIMAANQSGALYDVMVSTDDPEIASVSREWGAQVPWLRPPELARDLSPSIDAVIHALDWFEVNHGAMDGVMLLQPTSPFRSASTIRRAVELFACLDGRPVIGVSPSGMPPEWYFRVSDEGMTPVLGWEAVALRSQDFPPAYKLNGAMYLASPEFVRQNRTFLTPETYPLVMSDDKESVDIDTETDWQKAERYIA